MVILWRYVLKTINSLTGLEPVVAWHIKSLVNVPPQGPDPTLVYGVELEIEGLDDGTNFDDCLVPGMHHTEDGSLRNGREFITSPMKMRELDYTLRQFFRQNEFTEDNYSERCSVHVHVNVGDMPYTNPCSVFLLYQMYEKVLFDWIGGDRENNIFCAPWYTSLLGKNLLHQDYDSFEQILGRVVRWQKYTAVNLLPISTLNTIEWRHMGGTADVERILMWCRLIGCIMAWAKANTYEEATAFVLSLNTTSRYNEVCHSIFGEYVHEIFKLPRYKERLEEGILDAKYLLGGIKTPGVKKKAPPTSAKIEWPTMEQMDAAAARQEEFRRTMRMLREIENRIAPEPARNVPQPGDVPRVRRPVAVNPVPPQDPTNWVWTDITRAEVRTGRVDIQFDEEGPI